jgi:superfamily II DNA or RNA helicase
MILANVEPGQGAEKHHIVAPPGSGKTHVGIELIRRFGERAVIFALELSRRRQRAKHDLLRREDADVAQFLHPNARALSEDLVEHGVKTIVLDECHHLLDYWAVVLRHLIARVEESRVVGLTATLPSPDDDREYENYSALLGEVDFEVPTPAVVKEGYLAPYRDLAYFTEPTEREVRYLDNVQRAFEEEISVLAEGEVFRGWVVDQALGGPCIIAD